MAAQGLRPNFSNRTGSSEALGCRMGKYVIGGEPPKIQKLHAVITRALPGRGWEFVVNLAIFATSCTLAALPCTGPSNVRFVAVLLSISNTSQSNLHRTQSPTRWYLRFDVPDVGICLQRNVRISEIYHPRHRVNSSLHKHSAAEHGDVPAVVSYYLAGWWSAFAAPLFGGAPTTM